MKNPFRAFGSSPGLQRSVAETIERALASAGLRGGADPAARAAADAIEVPARELKTAGPTGPAPSPAGGAWEPHHFQHAAGSRAYKLYRPVHTAAAPMLLVMLHGCTQSAHDFALGTGMNRLADEHGFLVVYPEQSPQANHSGCWNWFQPGDQQRGAGEPAVIAGIVGEVMARHGVDGGRSVFVAGLSAGAAMGLVLGDTYPELFAAVGVHSGLPYGSAHDLPSALAAMKGGRGRAGRSASAGRRVQHAQPLIVFHGDRDHTVQASNASAIVEQASEAYQRSGGQPLLASQHSAQAPGGRRYTRTVYAPAAGPAHIESWLLHGAGHQWSGGDARGSHTDAKGPDASAQMLRFFQAVVSRP